jgi:ADP-dependent NAD(P)H-hydrate dehydratase / NAD(P)H-hydrate epimerase
MKKINYYTAAATRELDRLAIEEYNIAGFELMQRAAKAAYNALLKNWPNVKKVFVLCGTGNNGGDGFIMAALALKSGIDVELFVAGDLSSISGDAKIALEYALSSGLIPIPAYEFNQRIEQQDKFNKSTFDEVVIVDALLGTGLSGKVREPYSHLINDINSSSLAVLAVDIPSGLCSDTGETLGSAVKADVTITFIGRKIGLKTNSGTKLVGKLLFNDLNVPKAVCSRVPVSKVI